MTTTMKSYEDIQTVTCYRTPDGEEFTNLSSAEYQIERLNMVEKATEALEAGGSVADCLRIFGNLHIDPILKKVTKDSKLVIEYWQCRSTPGYQVRGFDTRGRASVWGDAGSWSGSYGGIVEISDLTRYASDSRSQLQP